MRKLLGIFAAGFLTVGVAGQASAVALGYTGSLTVAITGIAPIVFSGGGTAIVNGSGGAGHLTALSVASGDVGISGFVLPVTDPVAFPIGGLQVTANNGTGAFAGSGGAGFGGVMPLVGGTKVCLFGPCSSAVANITVPLGVVGGGGVTTVKGAVNVTVIGAPWTTGTAVIGTLTAMGGVSPLSNTGNPSGVLTLVTPVFISTNIGASAVLPAFGTFALHFVPEPGTLMLLGSGIAGLVAFGRSRRA
ncbi:MAG TPA: PEP-CTERM sorting domain-containing protein [Vicinamibacterales bacterium]|nr:PEP-CTERM sorting domain-containing protein [Vicinamibacterales bacterium]